MNNGTEKRIVLPISIVIPTYKEEKFLPRLLESIQKQFYQPAEIIVADRPSDDKTREIARKYGAKIVDGGKVYEGRNNGAKQAKEEVIFFFDADVILPHPYFLAEVFIQFQKKKADLGSSFYSNDKESEDVQAQILGDILYSGLNGLKQIGRMTHNLVAEAGIFLICKKSVFDKLEGFKPDVGEIGEDMDFVKRAIEGGYRYKILPLKVIVSPRRFDTPKKALKSLIGLATGTFANIFGLNKNKTFNKIVKKTYDMEGSNR